VSALKADGGFDRCAARYDELRPIDGAWWQVFERIVEIGALPGRRVLEVGSGTGALAAALEERAKARVWALDASQEMVTVARGRGVNARQGLAERLPFRRGWFDAVVMRMVCHLLDRPRALAEAARVLAPEGRIVIATEDPDSFESVWFTRFFPSVVVLDRQRFPSVAELGAELADTGFTRLAVETLDQRRTYTRERALEILEAKAYSTFELLDPAEYAEGLLRARAELPAEVTSAFRWLLLRAEC